MASKRQTSASGTKRGRADADKRGIACQNCSGLLRCSARSRRFLVRHLVQARRSKVARGEINEVVEWPMECSGARHNRASFAQLLRRSSRSFGRCRWLCFSLYLANARLARVGCCNFFQRATGVAKAPRCLELQCSTNEELRLG